MGLIIADMYGFDPLISALKAPTLKARCSALETLGKIDDPYIEKLLIDVLKQNMNLFEADENVDGCRNRAILIMREITKEDPDLPSKDVEKDKREPYFPHLHKPGL